MKVDFTTKLKDIRGDVLTERYIDKEGKQQRKDVTLSDVALTALTQDDAAKPINAVEKMLRYKIAERVFGKKSVDLTNADLVKIQDCIGESMPTTYVGACFKLLEK